MPLISTSELKTLRPLGLDALWRDPDELLADDALAGVSFLAVPEEDDAPEFDFCPITF